ncbi:MAG: helix-turn-helix domain-containing protein [Halobacteriales archaeon]|nr:helix-turn-helix domain-containing protein [Halobacteriales archaeon]
MINAQFRIQLPADVWIAEVSQAFPKATFRLLSGQRLEETAVELGETITDSPEAVIEALRDHPALTRVEVLETTARRVLVKYETTDTGLYTFAATASVAVEFPVVVENGWYEFDLTGTRAELEQLRETLDATELAYELLSLIDTARTETLLTDRQREVLEIAMRAGYFEVPRGCTLAAVAERAGIDKSTASTILRRGVATIVTWFLRDPGQKGRRIP